MRLAFGTLCKYADISHQAGFIHMMEAGIGGLLVPKVPIRIPLLYYAARIVFTRAEISTLTADNHFRLIVRNPKNDDLYDSGKQKIDVPGLAIEEYEDEAATSVVMALGNLLIADEGKHTLELYLNGSILDKQILGIKLTTPIVENEGK